MAGYNEIQVGRYNRFWQKFLSMKGPASVNELDPRIQPSLAHFHGVENRYLEAWAQHGFSQTIGAEGVGNLNGFRFVNPAGSNVVAVFEKVTVAETTADFIFFDYSRTAPVNLANVQGSNTGIDNRQHSIGTNLVLSNGIPVAIGFPIGFIAVPASQSGEFLFTDMQELVLPPNSGFQVRSQNLNLTLSVGFKWRERFLEESERS